MKGATDRETAANTLRARKPVLVVHRGRVTGIFLPLLDVQLSLQLRRKLFQVLTSEIARQLKRVAGKRTRVGSSAMDLKGFLPRPRRKISLREMDNAIARGARRSLR